MVCYIQRVIVFRKCYALIINRDVFIGSGIAGIYLFADKFFRLRMMQVCDPVNYVFHICFFCIRAVFRRGRDIHDTVTHCHTFYALELKPFFRLHPVHIFRMGDIKDKNLPHVVRRNVKCVPINSSRFQPIRFRKCDSLGRFFRLLQIVNAKMVAVADKQVIVLNRHA